MITRTVDRLQDLCGATADRAVLKLMSRLVTRTYRSVFERPDLARAARLRDYYADPAWIEQPERFYRPPTVHLPLSAAPGGDLPGGSRLDLKGASGFRPGLAELRPTWEAHPSNDVLRVRLWQKRGEPRPVALCLHGWACGWPDVDERAFGARHLYAAGYDVAFLMLPFHARRAEHPLRRAPPFPSPRLGMTAEGLAQSVWDVRRVLHHLRRDAPTRPVAVIGWSLGGLVAALLAGLQDDLAGVLVINPAVSVADLLWQHGRGTPERKSVEARGFTAEDLKATWAVCTPQSFPPRLPPDRLQIIAGRADRICTPDQARALATHWHDPPLSWHGGGHLLQFGRRQLRESTLAFLGRTLGCP